MFNFDRQPVTVSRLEVRNAIPSDNGKTLFNARVSLELQALSAEQLPFLVNAVKAIVSDSDSIEEGPNSVSVTVRRDFPPLHYSLSEASAKKPRAASFVGSVVNRPKVSIVEGALALAWTVETESVDEDNLRALAKAVALDGFVLSTSDPQLALPLA